MHRELRMRNGRPLLLHAYIGKEFSETLDEGMMTKNLTSEEESFIRGLIGSQRRGIPALMITANILLLLGGLTLAGTALFLAGHLTDALVYSVGLPNFIGGMLLIAGSMILSRRAASQKKLTSIVLKLSSVRDVP